MNICRKLAIVCALAVCGTAAAETSYMFDNPENQTYFGARVAIDMTTAANGGGNYSSNVGISAGAIYNIPLFMNLYFEPGLSIFYNTFGTSKWNSFVPEGSINPETGEGVAVYYQISGSIRNLGFRVPLLLGYHFDISEDLKVGVFTGPQLNMNLYARYFVTENLGNDLNVLDHDCSLFGTQGFKHLDLQWNFGVGVTFQQYYVALNGAWGLTTMKSSTLMLPRDLKRSLFTITLGYNF